MNNIFVDYEYSMNNGTGMRKHTGTGGIFQKYFRKVPYFSAKM